VGNLGLSGEHSSRIVTPFNQFINHSKGAVGASSDQMMMQVVGAPVGIYALKDTGLAGPSTATERNNTAGPTAGEK
jgi:hypothetical protein